MIRFRMLKFDDVKKDKHQQFSFQRNELLTMVASSKTWEQEKITKLIKLTTGRTKRILTINSKKQLDYEAIWDVVNCLAIDEQELRDVVEMLAA